MIEIHSHVLPDMDDGAGDLDEALQMLVDYAAQGVTRIACTPHLLPEHFASEASLNAFLDLRDEKITFLQAAAKARNIDVFLCSGTELTLSSAMLPYIKNPAYAERMSLNGGSYVLVELPMVLSGGIRMLDGLLFELQMAGLLPILAHPERTAHNEGVLPVLKDWVRSGRVLLQSNAGHIVEDPKLSPERQARYNRRRPIVRQMIQDGLVHIIASDAHDPIRRPPQNKLAFDEISRLCGKDFALRLMSENPRRILMDEPVIS